MKIKVKKIKAKSVLTPSKLPGADFVVNPYLGCSFGCQYCYAAFIGRWKHPGEKWGEFLNIKINAPEIFKKELVKYQKKFKSKNFGSIIFSSVTDPYLPHEAKYQITRNCLKILVDFGYQGEISILTKSPLVIRDIDLFKKLKNCLVGLTITTTDDKIIGFLEGSAPPASSRLKALEKLNRENINTYAFIGPILPYFVKKRGEFEKLFKTLEKIGVKEIWLEHTRILATLATPSD